MTNPVNRKKDDIMNGGTIGTSLEFETDFSSVNKKVAVGSLRRSSCIDVNDSGRKLNMLINNFKLKE